MTIDAGKQFTSKEFAQHASSMGIRVKIVPIEAQNSIGIVERYYGPIRRAYLIVLTKIPGISRDMALQMAFKAVNDTAGPDSLVPTLLVYGALPRMVENDVKTLNKRVQWQNKNATKGLRFVKLDKNTLRLLTFTNASFVNNRDLSS